MASALLKIEKKMRGGQRKQSPQGPGRKAGLTWQQEEFCSFLVKDVQHDGEAAAKKAKYKNPAVAAAKLLKNPAVKKYLISLKQRQEKETVKTAADALNYIQGIVYMNPAKFFSPGDDGGWLLDKKQWENLPDEVGQYIEEVEERVIETETSTKTFYWVKLVKKSVMVELLAKHHNLFEKDREAGAPKLVLDLSMLYQPGVPVDPLKVAMERANFVESKIVEEPKKVAYTLDELTKERDDG